MELHLYRLNLQQPHLCIQPHSLHSCFCPIPLDNRNGICTPLPDFMQYIQKYAQQKLWKLKHNSKTLICLATGNRSNRLTGISTKNPLFYFTWEYLTFWRKLQMSISSKETLNPRKDYPAPPWLMSVKCCYSLCILAITTNLRLNIHLKKELRTSW